MIGIYQAGQVPKLAAAIELGAEFQLEENADGDPRLRTVSSNVTVQEIGGGASGLAGTLRFPVGTVSHAGGVATVDLDQRYYSQTQLQTDGQAAVHWNNVTSKPATFPASAHAISHHSGGSDPLSLGSIAGTVASGQIANNAVTNAKLRDSAAASVIGRASGSTGDPADIVSSADGEVLRRSGTALGFGAVNLASASAVAGLLPAGNIASDLRGKGVAHVDAIDPTVHETVGALWLDTSSGDVLRIGTGSGYATVQAALAPHAATHNNGGSDPLAGSFTGITAVGTLTGLTVSGAVSLQSTVTVSTVIKRGLNTSLLSVFGGDVAGARVHLYGSTHSGTPNELFLGGDIIHLMTTSNADRAVVDASGLTLSIGVFAGNGSGLTSLNATNVSTGTLLVARGGTGRASVTTGNLVVGAGTGALTLLAPGVAGGYVRSNGSAWVRSTIQAADLPSTLTHRDANETISGLWTFDTGIVMDGSLFIGNGWSITTESATGAGELAFTPRTASNVTVLRFGAGGLTVENNGGTTKLTLTDSMLSLATGVGITMGAATVLTSARALQNVSFGADLSGSIVTSGGTANVLSGTLAWGGGSVIPSSSNVVATTSANVFTEQQTFRGPSGGNGVGVALEPRTAATNLLQTIGSPSTRFEGYYWTGVGSQGVQASLYLDMISTAPRSQLVAEHPDGQLRIGTDAGGARYAFMGGSDFTYGLFTNYGATFDTFITHGIAGAAYIRRNGSFVRAKFSNVGLELWTETTGGTPWGNFHVGPLNALHCHVQTDRPTFWFNRGIVVDDGTISSHDEDLLLQRVGQTKITVGSLATISHQRLRPASNGVTDLGESSFRWADLFLNRLQFAEGALRWRGFVGADPSSPAAGDCWLNDSVGTWGALKFYDGGTLYQINVDVAL